MDGSIRLVANIGTETFFDEYLKQITADARSVKLPISVAAGATDTAVEISNLGFDGILAFWDPDDTGNLSVRLTLVGNVARQVDPVHIISGCDVNGLVDIFVTNSSATAARELWLIGLVDSST